MSRMLAAVALVIAMVVARGARADRCYFGDLKYPNDHDGSSGIVGLYGAEVRVRRSSIHDGDAISLALGIDSERFHTNEPRLTLGGEHLAVNLCADCDNTWITDLAIQAELGAGYVLAGDRQQAFGIARLAFAMVNEREDGTLSYRDYSEQGGATVPRYRLRSQIDLVCEVRVAADHEVRIAFCVELDPVRWIADEARIWHWW